MKEDFEKQIDLLKKQHELSTKRLNNELEKLQGEKHALLSELERNNFNVKYNNGSSIQMSAYKNRASYKLNGSTSSYTNGGN
jgi:hypothetical protein